MTWVPLALTAGVPLQLVQKVTGHRTTEIVLKNYFQPGQEDFRWALAAAMPKTDRRGRPVPSELETDLDRLRSIQWFTAFVYGPDKTAAGTCSAEVMPQSSSRILS